MALDVIIQTTLNGLTLGAIYALLALGLTLLFSIMDILFFAHGACQATAGGKGRADDERGVTGVDHLENRGYRFPLFYSSEVPFRRGNRYPGQGFSGGGLLRRFRSIGRERRVSGHEEGTDH